MSRRKQANPKPAKRDVDLDEVAALVELPSELLCLQELEEEHSPPYAVFAKADLEIGNLIGAYRGSLCLEEPEGASDGGSYFMVNRTNGCAPARVMLQNGGHWLKLMRSAPQLADANICVRISGSDISCRVIQPVSRGVELRVTCSIADEPELASEPTDVEPAAGERDRGSGMLDASTSPATAVTDVDGMVEADNEPETKPRDCGDPKAERPEGEKSDTSVSPSLENSDWHMPFTETGEHKESLRTSASDLTCPNSEMSSTSSEPVQAKGKANGDRTYKCPLCAYLCYSEQYLVKHVAMHDVTTGYVDSESSRDHSSFCEECNIHFMSAKTYQAHKEVYCKARREMAQGEALHTYARGTEGSAVEDVFVVEKSSLPNGIPPVIQPQGFFAAISTNPLILLPCSVVNGQGFIPQNGIISTGAPIVLPGGVTGSAIIEGNGISLHPLEKDSLSQLNVSSKDRDLKQSAPMPIKYGSESDVLDLKKPERKDTDPPQQDAPLDLTVRKRKTSATNFPGQYQVAKRRTSFTTTSPAHLTANGSSPEPSYPHVAISPPSFSNDASSSSGMGALMPLTSMPVNGLHSLCKIPSADSPGPPVLLSGLESATQPTQPILPIGIAPSKLLKQGNNRCEYCNIVFYKYDNYLAHKKHYCAYRRQQLSSASESLSAMSDISNTDDNSNHDHLSKKTTIVDEKTSQHGPRTSVDYTSENVVPSASLYASKPHSSVFRCDACGVKFSTADNLNAHQTYYCSRKLDNSYSKYGGQMPKKNSKCRDAGGHRCSESESHDESGCSEEWKCNFCDAVCPTLKAARKHLLTHSEMRGFCCIVCGYRGNTLRGMRTHVYEHLNGNTSQIEDILASSLVVDSANACFRSMDCSDEETVVQDNRQEAEEPLKHKDTIPNHLVASSPSRCSRDPDDGLGSEDEHKSNKPQSSTNSVSLNNEQTCRRASKQEDNLESVYSRTLNPGTLCDVVIKTEDDDSAEKIIPERSTPSPAESLATIKDDPDSQEEEIDVEKTDPDKEDTKVKLGAVTSVICRVSAQKNNDYLCSDGEDAERARLLPKKRTRIPSKSELKYCKSCDISFHHLSNFIAHKKFYCVSRVLENFQHETAPVQ